MGNSLIAVILSLCASVQAIELPDKDKIFEPVFKEVDRPWRAQGIFELPLHSFYLGGPAVHGVAYVPNFAPRLGTKILYKDIGATITLALPIPDEEERRRGNSVHTGLVANSYWRQVAMDVFYHSFRGFYVASPFTELSKHKPKQYPQLPDARATTFGLNFYYVAAPSRYSLRAAFDLDEFQLKSGGSWVYNPFYTHFAISIGNEFVPGVGNEAIVELPNLASGRTDTVGLAVGYGYTLIYSRAFATAQAAMGPGLQYQRIRRSDGHDKGGLSPAAKLNLNVSFGWNSENYVGGVKFLLDTLWAEVSDTQVWSSLVNVQFFLGYRF